MGSEKMKIERKQVVIDAANIIRDDRGCIIRDEEGNRLSQIRPERLIAVINHVEERGGNPIALLREGTYYSGKKRSKSEDLRFGDWGLIENAIEKEKVLVVSDDDDLFCILYSIQSQALLISRDKFRDHQKSNPEVDWEYIKKAQILDYNFINGEFVSPTLHNKLSMATTKVKDDKKTEGKSKLQDESKSKGSRESKHIQKKTSKGKPKNTTPTKEEIDKMLLLDELYASIYSLTSDDSQANLSSVTEVLAREFLGKEGPCSDWKSGWPKYLKNFINSITGENLKVTTWIKNNIPTGFQVTEKGVIIKFE